MRIEFSEPSARLKLPKGKIGAGWKLVPFTKPTEASDCIEILGLLYMSDNYIMFLVLQLICICNTVINLNVTFTMQITREEVDGFGRGKRLPQCMFHAQWTKYGFKPTNHSETIQLCGTKKPVSITVLCALNTLATADGSGQGGKRRGDDLSGDQLGMLVCTI